MEPYNKKVAKLLDNKIFTRSNDKILYIEYIKEYSEIYKKANDKTKQAIIEIILEMPKESSLTRIRAYYQNNKGLYLPGLNTINNRKEAQEKYRKKFKQDTRGLFDGLATWFKKF